MSKNDEKSNIPVLYYEWTSDKEKLDKVIEPLTKYYERNDIRFILLPKNLTDLRYFSKSEILKMLDEVKKEVEKWD